MRIAITPYDEPIMSINWPNEARIPVVGELIMWAENVFLVESVQWERDGLLIAHLRVSRR